MILSDLNTGSNSNSNINSNSNKMNKTELKQNHPDVYSEIVSEGVNKEKERVASWMAYSEADSKAVNEGINSGAEISTSQSHAFLVAIANKGRLTDLRSDNVPAVVTNQTSTVENTDAKTAAEKEAESAFNFKL